MRKKERQGLADLLKKAVLRFQEMSKNWIITALDEGMEFPPKDEIKIPSKKVTYSTPDFEDIFDKMTATEEYENLRSAVSEQLPLQFRNKSESILKIVMKRAIVADEQSDDWNNKAAPYWWNEDLYQRGLNELMHQFSQPEKIVRLIAPIFNFDIEENVEIDSQIVIRKVTSYDRFQITDTKRFSGYTDDDFSCVLEIAGDENLAKKLHDKSEIFKHLASSATTAIQFTSCLRVFSNSLPHIRMVNLIIEGESYSFTNPILVGHPELALLSGPNRYILSKRYSHDLSIFWEKFKKVTEQDHFRRAKFRYDKAITNRDDTSKFIDYVLAIESLCKGSMADAQYRVVSLISYNNSIRRSVYDFLALVYRQRNPIMHGSKGFGRDFNKPLKEFYGEKRDLKWFIADLEALVRQCLRMSVLADTQDSKEWISGLSDILFQERSNYKLVGRTKGWALLDGPSFF